MLPQWIAGRQRQWLAPRNLAVVEACLIGLVAGLAAVLLKVGVGWVGGWRVQLSYLLPVWVTLPGIGLLGGALSGWLIERVAPETAGSGVPQVKAVLARVPLSLDLRVAWVKLIGATLAIGSGLVLGREGPTIQVGAAIAAQLSQWVPTSPDRRRQFIAAGASAGLAAAFNTPMAGVLFVVEALLPDVSGFALGTGVLASFVGAVVPRLLGGDNAYLSLRGAEAVARFHLPDLPIYLYLGILTGGMGVLFARGVMASLAAYKRLPLSLPGRIGMAGLLSGLAIAALPLEFRDSTGLRNILIAGGTGWQVTGVAFTAHFLLTLVAYGAGAPGGLSAPSLILGSSLGYLVGFFAQSSLGIGDPTAFALAGMAGLFSAVARTPVTAAIVVFETTTNFEMVLPLMAVSAIAYFVAERFDADSIYDRLLAWNGIDIRNPDSRQEALAQLTAADVMQRQVETLSVELSVDAAIAAFAQSHHRGFPVVDGDVLVGIVTQSDLDGRARRHLDGQASIRHIMTPRPVTIAPDESLAQVLSLLGRYQIGRLPVVEGGRLLGIITRSDIIRMESNLLDREAGQKVQNFPSYVVYQTRAPATGKGRLLVLLQHPLHAGLLLDVAIAIATDRNYEIECLCVLVVPRDRDPSRTPVAATQAHGLLRKARRYGRERNIPVHAQIRVAHDPAPAILEATRDRHIDTIVMGWKGNAPTAGRLFGSVVDTLLQQAPCSVAVVKLPHRIRQRPDNAHLTIERWLVPISGGPNTQQALAFLPGLARLGYAPEFRLCQVFHDADTEQDVLALEAIAESLNAKMQPICGRASAIAICAPSVPEAIADLTERFCIEGIVLGASRESLLQHAVRGNIPEAIARRSHCLVILFQSAP